MRRPLRVLISNEHLVSTTNVYHGCVLEILGVVYPIDLILIVMGNVCVIVGMDGLSQFGALCNILTPRYNI